MEYQRWRERQEFEKAFRFAWRECQTVRDVCVALKLDTRPETVLKVQALADRAGLVTSKPLGLVEKKKKKPPEKEMAGAPTTRTPAGPVPSINTITDIQVTDATPLAELRDWTRARSHAGVECPVCEQRVKVLRAGISSRDAFQLVLVHRAYGQGKLHPNTMIPRLFMTEGLDGPNPASFPSLRHWGFVREVGKPDDEVSRTRGWWQVTDRGAAFACGRLQVRSRIWLYNGKLLGIDEDSPMIGIRTALGDRLGIYELICRRDTGLNP